jgi:hypothetical protein
MTTSMQKYTFDTPTYELASSSGAVGAGHGKSKGKHHRRHSSKDSESHDHDPTDGSGSLTYSAASSINSNAGESTDSSFADIMRVLDVQDSKELAAVLQKERARHVNSHFGKHGSQYHHGQHHFHHGDERSIAAGSIAADSMHSLTYSTDAESHWRSLATDGESGLHGTGILGTIAGYVVGSVVVAVFVVVVEYTRLIFGMLFCSHLFPTKFTRPRVLVLMCHVLLLLLRAACCCCCCCNTQSTK